jgi:hypothetical protein
LPPDYGGIEHYKLGRKIAITTYSSVFNTNPRINDAQTLIMDDAHSAEDYIGNLWSVSISRRKHPKLYEDVIELLKPELGLFAHMLLHDTTPLYVEDDIDLVPQPSFMRYAGALGELLDQELKESEARYSWSVIRRHLHACCLYVARSEILLKPVIPPTLTHRPFEDAKQRVYMSATLGEGGELERITGIRRIERIPMPEGWDRQNSGRRLFLFPDLSLEEDELLDLVVGATKQSRRALVLTPTKSHVMAVGEKLKNADIDVVNSSEIEESLEPFTDREDVALILANRYDGIDLPGDSCRLLILHDLPGGTNLQERFLLRRLSATSVLRDRIRTRLIQAVGRCTRSSTDYATVLIWGQRLFDFCAASENRMGMHPELQAEIEFGIKNSIDMDQTDYQQLIELMQNQEEEWRVADADIVQKREGKEKRPDPLATTLMEVAPLEVDFAYAMWSNDYKLALQKAVQITDRLGGNPLMPYRGWWYYLGGVAAWLGGSEYKDNDLTSKAGELFGAAANCTKTVSWLAGLTEKMKLATQEPVDVLAAHACESIRLVLEDLGLRGQKFELRMAELEEQISAGESTSFEAGLTTLGRLLGYQAIHPATKGAPDSVWILDGRLIFVFEAKSHEKLGDGVSLRTVRQALTHTQWVRDNCNIAVDAEIIPLLVTPRTRIDLEAQRNANGLFYWHSDDARQLLVIAISVLRRIRAEMNGIDNVAATEQIHAELAAEDLLPAALLSKLKEIPLNRLPIS